MKIYQERISHFFQKKKEIFLKLYKKKNNKINKLIHLFKKKINKLGLL